jgi:hypothetical protein
VTVKTSEKSILRIKDLKEQPEDTRFVLLPGGLDRVIICCNWYDVTDGIITAYLDKDLVPIFAAPVAGGFIIVDRQLTDTESMAQVMTRMYHDEKEAELLHDELTRGDESHKHKHHGDGKVVDMFPGPVPAAPTDGPKPPPTGQYL